MDSLWPYLQVKQPYLDCVTTIRVRLQGAFSALGEAVKCMIDHVERFHEGPDETFGTQDTDAVQVRIRARQPSMYPCLPRRAWAYWKESLRGHQGLPAKVRR
jgi:hypothetical protein